MENTGSFKDGSEVTSIMIVDTDSTSLMFKKDELTFVQHLESLADQIIEFSYEDNQTLKTLMPTLDLKRDTNVFDFWQSPYLRYLKSQT